MSLGFLGFWDSQNPRTLVNGGITLPKQGPPRVPIIIPGPSFQCKQAEEENEQSQKANMN